MSRRTQKKVSTDGSVDKLAESPFAALDKLAARIPLAQARSATTGDKTATKSKAKPRTKGRVEVRREKAGRGGKTVTTLQSFPSHIPLKTLETMVFDLKKQCACGGTLKGRVIELQGDVCGKVCDILNGHGYHAVRAGG